MSNPYQPSGEDPDSKDETAVTVVLWAAVIVSILHLLFLVYTVRSC